MTFSQVRLTVLLAIGIAFQCPVAPSALAEQTDFAVAGYEGDLLLLRLPDEATADSGLSSMTSRTFSFGNRDGNAGSSTIASIVSEAECDAPHVVPRASVGTALAGRDRPTQWSAAHAGIPASPSVGAIVEAQLAALGPKAAVKSAYAWNTDAGVMVVEVTAALPDDAPDEFDGKRSTGVYLFGQIAADWSLSGVLMSSDGDTTDSLRTVEVLAVGRDPATGEVQVFVWRHWYEWSTFEQFIAQRSGWFPRADAYSGVC